MLKKRHNPFGYNNEMPIPPVFLPTALDAVPEQSYYHDKTHALGTRPEVSDNHAISPEFVLLCILQTGEVQQ